MLYRFPPERCPYVLAACVALTAAPAFGQDAFGDAFWQFKAASGFDYSSGFYGAAKPTDILYVPVSVAATKGPWELKIASGWVSVSGPALLVDGGGADAALGIRSSGTATGVADVNLYAKYSLEQLYQKKIFIDFTGRLKAPAASFNKGLGTGEWDGAFDVSASTTLGDFMPFAQVGYKIMSSPAGFKLRNVFFGSVGAQYAWNDRFITGVTYEYRQASLATAKDPQEGSAYVSWRVTPKWTLVAYGVAGFSRNSPSGGGGLTINYRWP